MSLDSVISSPPLLNAASSSLSTPCAKCSPLVEELENDNLELIKQIEKMEEREKILVDKIQEMRKEKEGSSGQSKNGDELLWTLPSEKQLFSYRFSPSLSPPLSPSSSSTPSFLLSLYQSLHHHGPLFLPLCSDFPSKYYLLHMAVNEGDDDIILMICQWMRGALAPAVFHSLMMEFPIAHNVYMSNEYYTHYSTHTSITLSLPFSPLSSSTLPSPPLPPTPSSPSSSSPLTPLSPNKLSNSPLPDIFSCSPYHNIIIHMMNMQKFSSVYTSSVTSVGGSVVTPPSIYNASPSLFIDYLRDVKDLFPSDFSFWMKQMDNYQKLVERQIIIEGTENINITGGSSGGNPVMSLNPHYLIFSPLHSTLFHCLTHYSLSPASSITSPISLHHHFSSSEDHWRYINLEWRGRRKDWAGIRAMIPKATGIGGKLKAMWSSSLSTVSSPSNSGSSASVGTTSSFAPPLLPSRLPLLVIDIYVSLLLSHHSPPDIIDSLLTLFIADKEDQYAMGVKYKQWEWCLQWVRENGKWGKMERLEEDINREMEGEKKNYLKQMVANMRKQYKF